MRSNAGARGSRSWLGDSAFSRTLYPALSTIHIDGIPRSPSPGWLVHSLFTAITMSWRYIGFTIVRRRAPERFSFHPAMG